MEHCDSDMERDLVQDPKIPLQAIHSFLKQMQSALDYLFNYNMIHSDIKPSNILTQRSQVIQPGPSVSIWSPEWGTIFKLCDFGSVISFQHEFYNDDVFVYFQVKDLTVMGRNAGSYLSMSYDGTKAYNAPEMRKHHVKSYSRYLFVSFSMRHACFQFDLLNRKPRVKDVNAKVDSWSVGIILLQCLVGRAPEGQEVKRELEILRKNPELLQFIQQVLQPLLEEDSHQRAFVHELEF